MGTDDRGIDRDNPAEVAFGLGQERGEHPLPCAVGRPLPQRVVGCLPRAELRRQIHPGRAGAVLPGDGVDRLSVVPPPATPLRGPVWQQRLDPGPLGLSQRHHRTNDRMVRRKRPSCAASRLRGARNPYRLGGHGGIGGSGAGPRRRRVGGSRGGLYPCGSDFGPQSAGQAQRSCPPGRLPADHPPARHRACTPGPPSRTKSLSTRRKCRAAALLRSHHAAMERPPMRAPTLSA